MSDSLNSDIEPRVHESKYYLLTNIVYYFMDIRFCCLHIAWKAFRNKRSIIVKHTRRCTLLYVHAGCLHTLNFLYDNTAQCTHTHARTQGQEFKQKYTYRLQKNITQCRRRHYYVEDVFENMGNRWWREDQWKCNIYSSLGNRSSDTWIPINNNNKFETFLGAYVYIHIERTNFMMCTYSFKNVFWWCNVVVMKAASAVAMATRTIYLHSRAKSERLLLCAHIHCVGKCSTLPFISPVEATVVAVTTAPWHGSNSYGWHFPFVYSNYLSIRIDRW